MKLFFLHHAGGSAYIFKKWLSLLNNICAVLIDLPGHGQRIKEPLLSDYEQITDFIFSEIINAISCNEQYMVFGHSMGGMLAYSVSQMLSESEYEDPSHLFLSACNPPGEFGWGSNSEEKNSIEDLLSRQDITGEIPGAILESEELRDIFLPILQTDIELLHRARIKRAILHIPLSILHGRDDAISFNTINRWEEYSTEPCHHLCFPGGHFYLNSQYAKICEYINLTADKILNQYSKGGSVAYMDVYDGSFEYRNERFSSFCDVMNKQAEKHPYKTAFIQLSNGKEVGRINYQRFKEQVDTVAEYLSFCGLKGERIYIMLPPSIPFFICLFACFCSQNVAVPGYDASSIVGKENIAGIIRASNCGAIIFDETISSNLQEYIENSLNETPLLWISLDNVPTNNPVREKPFLYKPDDIICIQYTSGTTNNPKGVQITNLNLLDNSKKLLERSASDENDVLVNVLPFTHNMGLIITLAGFMGGFTSVLLPTYDVLQNPLLWLEAMSSYKATISGAPNSFFERCVRFVPDDAVRSLDLSNLRVAFNGGERIQSITLDRFTKKFGSSGFQYSKFMTGYGMTECTLIITVGKSGIAPITLRLDTVELENNRIKILDTDSVNNHTKVLVSNGWAFDEEDVVIVHPDTSCRCTERVGEIWVSGKSVTYGYYKIQDDTEHKFNCYLSDNKKRRYFATGDLGFFYQNQLFIVDRLSDVIVINGHNHYATDIESTIGEIIPKQAGNIVVFPVQCQEGENIFVVIGLNTTDSISEDQMSEMCARIVNDCFAKNKVTIHNIIFTSQKNILKTALGKNRKNLIKRAFESNEIDIYYQWNAR
jgi:acyl-CoA synthetase (AMP-forming)/AMP-acid ligase II/surfactin synthase thioesterase subunit